jgi:enoyl-CoA hydratase
MTAIDATSDGGIVVLRLDRPPVNALDVETLNELSDRIDDALEGDADAVVVTGTGEIFSAGADLEKVLASGPADVHAGIDALSRNFRTLFTFPRPIVAAVNGFALAGGAVITCACDHRVMGRTGRIGAVEHSAGVPFPSWALEVVRHNVPAGHFQDVVLRGRAYKPEEALRLGLIDEVVDDERVLSRATEIARELALIPRVTYALTKALARQPSVVLAEDGARRTDDEVKRAWNSVEVREAIQRRLDSLGGR